MSFSDALLYFERNNLNVVDKNLANMAPDYCFLVTYTYMLLVEGYGIPSNTSITVLSEVNGHAVGWALGAILYEINSMPWRLEPTMTESNWKTIVVTLFIGKVHSQYVFLHFPKISLSLV